jgi:predicted small lipoprotein YifL
MKAPLVLAVLAACGGKDAPQLPDAAAAADADPSIDAAPARETIMEIQNLEPGELVEGIMTGGRSDTALIHLVAPMVLDWNIHSHATGHAVTVYEEYGKPTVDYPFTPPDDGDWYLLIKNSGNVTADIQVNVRLYGALSWRWQ